MKNTSIKTVVAIGIGAALFFVLGRFVAIPSGVPNTNISLQYAVLGLLAAMYGPLAGGLIGGSGGAAALEIVLHQTQRTAVLVQQVLGQLQLIPELSRIQIVAAQRVEAGGQGGDGLLIHRALQGSEGTVGKEVGNLLRQSIAVIEGDLGDADAVPNVR